MGKFEGALPSAHRKTAAFPPQPPQGEGGATSRNIPKGHPFDSRALKPLSKALWASTVALGHTLTAYRHLSRIKSATVSPDGNLGGRGYVQRLADMRQKLYEASEALSAISDTIFDEINAPHWKPKLAQLDDSDKEDVQRFIDEAQEVMDNPEGEAEEEIEAIEDAPSKKDEKASKGDDEAASEVPEAGDAPSDSPSPVIPKQASARVRGALDMFVRIYGNTDADPSGGLRGLFVKTNSSEPVGELPGGPRVDHLGPGTGNGEYGDFSEAETLAPPADDWSADGAGISRREEGGEDYDYTSEWENDFSKASSWKAPTDRSSLDTLDGSPTTHARLTSERKRLATAGIPDSSSDDTGTDAWDFGIGYGARGDGAGGYENPSGEGNGTKGVEGPHSGLPGSPAQSSGDTTRTVLDDKLNPRQAIHDALYGQARLPQDAAGLVSRSDYFPGAKDNMVSVGTAELPSAPPAEGRGGQPLLNTYFTQEDVRTPYVRFDHATRNLRDPVHAAGEVK